MYTQLQLIRPHLRQRSSTQILPRSVLNIGLTGGVGAGKSTVSALLRAHGLSVVDLDQISHHLTAVDGLAMPSIERMFGAGAVLPDGSLNRAYMRDLVFDQPEIKNQLSQLLRPWLIRATQAQAEASAHARPNTAVIYDIPLLVENPFWLAQLDWVVVVECSRAQQMIRVQRRNPDWSAERILSIMDAQASPEARRAVANVLLDNHSPALIIDRIHSTNDANPLNIGRQVDILVTHIAALMRQMREPESRE